MIMQKLKMMTTVIMVVGLVACVERTPVGVVSSQADTTIVSAFKPQTSSVEQVSLPDGVTAICQDGSFSKATDNTACVGNGGIKTFIGRYHSE